MKLRLCVVCLLLICINALAEVTKNGAPGGPGMVPNWSVAKKVQVGTYYNKVESPVWFTNASGVLTETYFPTIDKAHIKDAQIIVSNGAKFFVEERQDMIHEVEVLSPSLVKLVNKEKNNKFEIHHTYFTLENEPVLVDEVVIKANMDGLKYYLLVNPAMNNTGYHDTAKVVANNTLEFSESQYKLNVSATVGFEKSSVGFVQVNDGFQQVLHYGKLNYIYNEAVNGNVAGTSKIAVPSSRGEYKFYVIYSFGGAKSYSQTDLAKAKQKYQDAWEGYFSALKDPGLSGQDKLFYNRTLYTLRVHEDKLHPGAMIASLSKPWGDEVREYPGVFVGGYHLVWPRDLFHVSLAMIEAGDMDTPERALNYLKSIQYKSGEWKFDGRLIKKKGAFPQNVWTHGGEYWGGLQLDQVGFPVQLFYHLFKRSTPAKQQELMQNYGDMVKLALDFIMNYGPWSAQERWEENFGISPSTFSVATASLVLGTKIFNDPKYLNMANSWMFKPKDNIHAWTFTQRGLFGDGQYYIRVAGCSDHTAQWDPDNGATCIVANSGKPVDQTKLLDQGFLKLALMGLVPASDWRLKTSLEKVNTYIRKQSKEGYSAWYRYSYDAYGENKQGRLWPLLSSEHARYEIERFQDGDLTWEEAQKKADHILKSYQRFANDGLMIPEQVFEHNFEGTGAATPLAWSHAEYLKTFWSIKQKRNVENPLGRSFINQ